MKTAIQSSLILFAVAFCGSHSQAHVIPKPPSPWSLGFSLGADYAHRLHYNYTDVATSGPETTTVINSVGKNYSGSLGYSRNRWRVELELLHANSPSSRVKTTNDIAVANTNGDTSLTATLVDLVYHIQIWDSPIVPYVGAGLGYGKLRTQINSLTFRNLVTGSKSVMAYQGMFGAHYQITPHVATEFGYRYISSNKDTFSLRDPVTGAVSQSQPTYYHTHTLNLGLVFRF